jgi:hypothetical protein
MFSSSVVPDANARSELFPTLYVSPMVREVQNQDGAVLLDLQQGICFGMTPVGIEIWESFKKKQSLDEVCKHLFIEYPEVPRESIAEDVEQFVRELQIHRLASTEPTQSSRVHLPRLIALVQRRVSAPRRKEKPRRPRFLFWRVLIGLAAFDLFKFGSNFPRIHEFVRGWGISSHAISDNIADLVCDAVNRACVWYPKRVLCLQRSAVTTCLLRYYGIHAQMVMGAQKFPFKAHAWTEVNGRPVNERRNVQRLYLVWERC